MSLKKRASKSIALALVGVTIATPLLGTVYADSYNSLGNNVDAVDSIKEYEVENTYALEGDNPTNLTQEQVGKDNALYENLEKNNPEYLKKLFNIDYLESEIPKVNLSPDKTIYTDLSNKNDVMLRSMAVGWEIYSKKAVSTQYGAWRNGPSGSGPATLGINSGAMVNRTFTNTISGSYPIGEGSIGGSLGVTIGKTNTYGTSYSISIPKGQRKMIIFRPRYKTYKVDQRYYAKGTLTGKTATAYVSVFDDWDYSSKNI